MDPVTWSFTTDAPDTTKPTVTSRTPAPGATGVATGTTVTGVFSEAVQQATIGFVLRNPANAVVPSTTSYNATTRTVTLTPSAALSPSTTYTATLSGATDTAGNVMDPVTLVVHDDGQHLQLPVHDLAGARRPRRRPTPTPARSSSA